MCIINVGVQCKFVVLVFKQPRFRETLHRSRLFGFVGHIDSIEHETNLKLAFIVGDNINRTIKFNLYYEK